ncbi:hypothetical protein BTVI_142361 [Pitangus sulphuratus]|nr:hypothetical protein BTVI_142361 [Pitangus sulphuratus]
MTAVGDAVAFGGPVSTELLHCHPRAQTGFKPKTEKSRIWILSPSLMQLVRVTTPDPPELGVALGRGLDPYPKPKFTLEREIQLGLEHEHVLKSKPEQELKSKPKSQT